MINFVSSTRQNTTSLQVNLASRVHTNQLFNTIGITTIWITAGMKNSGYVNIQF